MYKTRVMPCIAVLVGLASGCNTNDSESSEASAPAEVNNEPMSPKGDNMAATKTKQIWNAYIKYDDGDEKFAGQLAVEKGVLSIVSAEGDEESEYLNDAIEDMNNRDHLVDVAPPKGDAPRYSLGADEYTRDDPEFEKVLARKLEENHDLRVEPAK